MEINSDQTSFYTTWKYSTNNAVICEFDAVTFNPIIWKKFTSLGKYMLKLIQTGTVCTESSCTTTKKMLISYRLPSEELVFAVLDLMQTSEVIWSKWLQWSGSWILDSGISSEIDIENDVIYSTIRATSLPTFFIVNFTNGALIDGFYVSSPVSNSYDKPVLTRNEQSIYIIHQASSASYLHQFDIDSNSFVASYETSEFYIGMITSNAAGYLYLAGSNFSNSVTILKKINLAYGFGNDTSLSKLSASTNTMTLDTVNLTDYGDYSISVENITIGNPTLVIISSYAITGYNEIADYRYFSDFIGPNDTFHNFSVKNNQNVTYELDLGCSVSGLDSLTYSIVQYQNESVPVWVSLNSTTLSINAPSLESSIRRQNYTFYLVTQSSSLMTSSVTITVTIDNCLVDNWDTCSNESALSCDQWESDYDSSTLKDTWNDMKNSKHLATILQYMTSAFLLVSFMGLTIGSGNSYAMWTMINLFQM